MWHLALALVACSPESGPRPVEVPRSLRSRPVPPPPAWEPVVLPEPTAGQWDMALASLALEAGQTPEAWIEDTVRFRLEDRSAIDVDLRTGAVVHRQYPKPPWPRPKGYVTDDRDGTWVDTDGRRVSARLARPDSPWDRLGDRLAVQCGTELVRFDVTSGAERNRVALDRTPTEVRWSPAGRLAVAAPGWVEVRSASLALLRRWSFDGCTTAAHVLWSPDGSQLLAWCGPLPALLDVEVDAPRFRPEYPATPLARLDPWTLVQHDTRGTAVWDADGGRLLPVDGAAVHYPGPGGVELEVSGRRVWTDGDDVDHVAPGGARWVWRDDQLIAFTQMRGQVVDPDTGRVVGEVNAPAVAPPCRLAGVPWRSDGESVGFPDPAPCPAELAEIPRAIAIDPAGTAVFVAEPAGIAVRDGAAAVITRLEGASEGRWSGGLWSADGLRVASWNGPLVGIWQRDGTRLGSWRIRSGPEVRAAAIDRRGDVIVVQDKARLNLEVHDVFGALRCRITGPDAGTPAAMSPDGTRVVVVDDRDDTVAMLDLRNCEFAWASGRRAGAGWGSGRVPRYPVGGPL